MEPARAVGGSKVENPNGSLDDRQGAGDDEASYHQQQRQQQFLEENNPAHRAASFVPFVLRRSQTTPPDGALTQLAFLSTKTLWLNERSALARLIQLETIVADRAAEEKRGLRALAREQRRLAREKRSLKEKQDALETYRKILSMSTSGDANVGEGEDEDEEEEEEFDDDDYDEDEDYEDNDENY